MKINNKTAINETFAAVPTLKKVHITANGEHYFNEGHAKYAEGKKDEEGKPTANTFKSLAPDAAELKEGEAK